MKESYKVETQPVALASSDASCRATGRAKRSQRYTGQCIELRKHPCEVADLILSKGRQQSCRTIWRVRQGPHGVKDHWHGWKLSSRKPRDPGDIRFKDGSGSVGEGARPQVRHGRYWGVRQFHSTEEAGEQGQGATARGVGGGKGTDQGERRAIATGPDTAPELGRETVGSQVAWTAGCT